MTALWFQIFGKERSVPSLEFDGLLWQVMGMGIFKYLNGERIHPLKNNSVGIEVNI